MTIPHTPLGMPRLAPERKAWAEFLDSILGSNGGPIHVSSGEPEHVAQPPSAGDFEEPPPRAGVPHDRVEPPPVGDRLAKPGKAEYRRNLPHLQVEGKTIFLTFCTTDHLILPESIRTQVLRHCLHDHGSKMHVHGVVVMPDHVHMVFAPLWDARGYPYTLAEITNGIKGALSRPSLVERFTLSAIALSLVYAGG